ncbi:hypothetical protein ACQHIH_16175 [Xanthomonas sontii]|uniref:hypothetical protein n=1 Tax=Xanthomonas sontii TaxID=2650745 RepID=UPI003F85E79F
MKTTAEMIEVMQAHERGQELELFMDGVWRKLYIPPSWNWSKYDYRIKPREPRVIWINEYKDGDYIKYAVHESEDDATGMATEKVTRTAVKFIEVVE